MVRRQQEFHAKDLQPSKNISVFDLCLVTLNYAAFILMLFFNIAAYVPLQGLFLRKSDEILFQYTTHITPDRWVFITIAIIYAWQGLWLIYNLALFFVFSDYGRMYKLPPVFTPQFHLFMLANFLLNIGWLFLWDALHFGVCPF